MAERINFQTHPNHYKHLEVEVEGPIAKLIITIPEDGGLGEGYELKLNSYDLGVDIELADAVNRLRFEHPEVSCVMVTSGLDGCFSSGANIFMLGKSSHPFKVNFCKYTNETRLSIEDASQNSGQRYVAALNGVCSGGGYELALACEEIYLIDDRKSAVSLPEIPFLGVLPGTGGLTRVVDKRMVRRDHADVFCTLAEGFKGKRAKEWGFVDEVFPRSKFEEGVAAKVKDIAGKGYPERKGIELKPLNVEFTDDAITYDNLKLEFEGERVATLTIDVGAADIPADPHAQGSDYLPLHIFRQLDDLLVNLRFNYLNLGLVMVQTRGDAQKWLAFDKQIAEGADKDWFLREVLLFMKRTLKRTDLSAKSFFSLVDKESCFVGSLYEIALASDRIYAYDDEGVSIQMGPLSAGALPMSNGLTRLQTRFLGQEGKVKELLGENRAFDSSEAEELGLVTLSFDDLDWDDEIRLAKEERASMSPDALTGMEASLRFAGPETLETKIFGRLSAWQNWIFQRPNAVGERGALKLFGQPQSPEFDWGRT